jgi:catechol 2,3-dioxygenase-like lactoylglutathione lyase family enzyme
MNTLDTPSIFLATTDAARARDFYEGSLGFPCLGDMQWAIRFQVGPVILNLQKVQSVAPAPYTQLGWTVADIESTIDGLARKGVKFERYPGMPQDAAGIMTMPNQARIAWFKDPDGHTLSLTQVLGG